jgi:hypothetical protein
MLETVAEVSENTKDDGVVCSTKVDFVYTTMWLNGGTGVFAKTIPSFVPTLGTSPT